MEASPVHLRTALRHAAKTVNPYPNTPEHIQKAIHEYVPTLNGWLLPERGCEMADAIFETRPKLCVEIGVFGGRSLISQAFALRELNHGGLVVGIDPWRLEDAIDGEQDEANRNWWARNIDIEAIHRGAMKAIWDHRIEPWCTVIRGASQYAAPVFTELDMLFIDGCHSELASMRDVELWIPKLRQGAYCFLDDYSWPSTQEAYKVAMKMLDVVKVGSEVLNGKLENNRYLVCRKK